LSACPTWYNGGGRLAASYNALLSEIPGVETPFEPVWARSNWQSYCVRLRDGADQQAVMQSMLDRGVATRRGIMCAHREAPYADIPLPLSLPSERAQDRCIILPLYPQMTEDDQRRVADALREACS
jgi:perosamine synthetase